MVPTVAELPIQKLILIINIVMQSRRIVDLSTKKKKSALSKMTPIKKKNVSHFMVHSKVLV